MGEKKGNRRKRRRRRKQIREMKSKQILRKKMLKTNKNLCIELKTFFFYLFIHLFSFVFVLFSSLTYLEKEK